MEEGGNVGKFVGKLMANSTGLERRKGKAAQSAISWEYSRGSRWN